LRLLLTHLGDEASTPAKAAITVQVVRRSLVLNNELHHVWCQWNERTITVLRRLEGNHMEFSIREVSPQDFGAVCELFEDVEALHRNAVPRVFRKPEGRDWIRDIVSAATTDGDSVLFVAEGGGRVVGLAHAAIRRAPDLPFVVPRRYAVIQDLVVSEDSRGSGIGGALVEKVHEWALDKGVSEVELYVWEFNRAALAFYEKHGYETARRVMWRTLRKGP